MKKVLKPQGLATGNSIRIKIDMGLDAGKPDFGG